MSEPEIGSYRDADGAYHKLVVRQTADGGWNVLDLDAEADAAHVVEVLSDGRDGRPQAEAIARDYLTTISHSPDRAGRDPGEAISEQGGCDDRSHRRPRTGPRTQPARRVALPHPAR